MITGRDTPCKCTSKIRMFIRMFIHISSFLCPFLVSLLGLVFESRQMYSWADSLFIFIRIKSQPSRTWRATHPFPNIFRIR